MIEHEYLKSVGYKFRGDSHIAGIDNGLRVWFDHESVLLYYDKDYEVYCFYSSGEQFTFNEILGELRNQFGFNTSCESFKLYKRSCTVKKVLNG